MNNYLKQYSQIRVRGGWMENLNSIAIGDISRCSYYEIKENFKNYNKKK